MKLRVKKLSSKGTFEIYVEIKKGYNPVIDARVTAVQTSSEGTMTFELFDITKSSGVYKKLIIPPTHGTFKIEVFANDNGNTAYIAEGSHQNHAKQPGK